MTVGLHAKNWQLTKKQLVFISVTKYDTLFGQLVVITAFHTSDNYTVFKMTAYNVMKQSNNF